MVENLEKFVYPALKAARALVSEDLKNAFAVPPPPPSAPPPAAPPPAPAAPACPGGPLTLSHVLSSPGPTCALAAAPDEGIRLRGPMVGEELGELLRCGLEEPHDHLAAVAREHGSQRWRLLQDGQHLLDQAARDREEDVLHRGQVTRQDLARHVRISGWGQGQGQG